MNFEVQTDFERKREKPLTINLIDDLETTASSPSSRSSFYRDISRSWGSFGHQDTMAQIVCYETIISRDFVFYMGLIWLGSFLSAALIALYFTKHEGFWMGMTCLLEAFSLYTWIIGVEAKKKLKVEIHYTFLSCLFGVILIKTMMSFLGFYSIFAWDGSDISDDIVPDKSILEAIDLTIVFNLLQLFTSVYVFYEGRKLLDLLLKRKRIMGDIEEVDGNDIAVL